MPQLLRWLAWLAYCGIAVAVGVEVMVRLLMPQVLPIDAPQIYRPDTTIGWRHTPNVRALANTGDRDVLVCTDDRGDRVSCEHPHHAHCSGHVLVVGDSFVEALAVPFDETAWARLEQDSGACLDVTGVSGYEPSQYLELVRERLHDAATHYDAVLVSMYVGNDFVTDAERVPPPQSVWHEPIRLLPPSFDEDGLVRWLHPFDQWIESRSHAYVALRFAIRNARDPGDVGIYGLPIAVVRDHLTPAILDATTRAFTLMADETRRSGAPLLLTIVPARVQVLDPQAERLRRVFPALASSLDMDLVSKTFVPRVQGITGIARVVDLLPILRSDPHPDYWGARDQHFSALGHQAWFAALRVPLRSALALRTP